MPASIALQVTFSERDAAMLPPPGAPAARTAPALGPPPLHTRRRSPGAHALAALAAAATALAGGAHAQDAGAAASFADGAAAALQQESRAAAGAGTYELHTTVLPAVDGGGWHPGLAQRGGVAGAGVATQHLDVTRWLTPDAGASLGFSLGVASAAPSANAAAMSQAHAPAAAALPPPRLDLGVRWRSRLDEGRHLHVAAWAETPFDAIGLLSQRDQLVYGTRVEMQWKSSRTRGVVPEFGAIGVQLQGSSRLVLRARKGGPMLYYRTKF